MGRRGEVWVVLQLLFLWLIFISPKYYSIAVPFWLRLFGILLILAGGLLGGLALLNLGRNLTPFPKPKEGGYLVSTGVYAYVRHPVYSGLVLGSFGWVLLTGSVIGVPFTIALLILLDLKSRQEEIWLSETYPNYWAYQKKVKKLIPFLY